MKTFLFLILTIVELNFISCIFWEDNNWAYACDFDNNDYRNVESELSECGPLCLSDPTCTHFTWTNFNGGTCWMKKGTVSKSNAYKTWDYSMICGILLWKMSSNDEALCTQDEFNNALTSNGYPSQSQIVYQNCILQAQIKGGINSKQQLAIFLAQIFWESDGLRAVREYKCYPVLNSGCEYNSGGGYPGQYYYGRGYIQLSWDFNYRDASESLFGDSSVLLEDPDQVASNNELSWSTAFWFWKIKVIDGPYGPQVLNNKFGAATNAINGALECRGDNQNAARSRFAIYKKILVAFNLNVFADETGCYN